MPPRSPAAGWGGGGAGGGGGGATGTELDALYEEVSVWQAVSAANLPACCHLHAVRESSRKVYMVMDLLGPSLLRSVIDADGAPLFTCAATGAPLSEARARALFHDAFTALAGCHTAGIAHGDVKPDNLLVVAEGRHAVLVDFGKARVMRAETPCVRDGPGTLAFGSPESLGDAPYDPFAADVWASGATLYASLAGRLPCSLTRGAALLAASGAMAPGVEVPASAAIRAAIEDGTIDPLTRVVSDAWDARHCCGGSVTTDDAEWVPPSPDLLDLLPRLLDRDPATRLTAAAAMRHSWFTN